MGRVTKADFDAATSRLRCCAGPVIQSDWAYGVSGLEDELPDHLILRVSRFRCGTCGTTYEIDEEEPVEQVQRDSLALRIVPIRRRPS